MLFDSMFLNIPPCSFFIHKAIEAFADAVIQQYGCSMEKAFLFPSRAVSMRCVQFLRDQVPYLAVHSIRIVDLYPITGWSNAIENSDGAPTKPIVSAVLFPRDHAMIAKTFWQHSGDGISSRRAEYCQKAFNEGRLAAKGAPYKKMKNPNLLSPIKGPRRYQKKDIDMSAHEISHFTSSLERKDSAQFVEERFGRNLDGSLAANAKLAIRRRIAGALTANVDLQEALEISQPPTRQARVEGLSEEDVYLHPCGMSSIFNTHRTMMICRGPRKSISYG